MRILIVGSGGREYAIAQKLILENPDNHLYLIPGSEGMKKFGQCIAINPLEVDVVAEWAQKEEIDLVIIGPEGPLVQGLANKCSKLGLKVFGHDQSTSLLEGSKSYAKRFMAKYQIPTATSYDVMDWNSGELLIKDWPHELPIVLKADGLAGGKGVVIAASKQEALETLRLFLGGKYGEASQKIVLEEFLSGIELSQHLLVDVNHDHRNFCLFPACQDHKKLNVDDKGPNTGGMGAFAPIPFLTEEDVDIMKRLIIDPTLKGLQTEGLIGRGVLFLGIMWTSSGPKLLEYNCRFGDPETQVLMAMMNENLLPLLLQVSEQRLCNNKTMVEIKPGTYITYVLAASGYPEKLDPPVEIPCLPIENTSIIHSGTVLRNRRWFAHGGRVLSIVVSGNNLEQAQQKGKKIIAQVAWMGMQYRPDIGERALRHHRLGKNLYDSWNS